MTEPNTFADLALWQAGFNKGVSMERNRIVALLKRSAEERGQCCQGHGSERQLILDQVALIKGETA